MNAPVLEPRDRGHRWRSQKYRQQILYYLAGFGINVHTREDTPTETVKLSEIMAEEDWEPEDRGDAGSLLGLKHWSISTRSDVAHSWSENLNEANRRKGRKRWAAVVGYRRSPARAGQQFCVMDLETFAEVVRITEGMAD